MVVYHDPVTASFVELVNVTNQLVGATYGAAMTHSRSNKDGRLTDLQGALRSFSVFTANRRSTTSLGELFDSAERLEALLEPIFTMLKQINNDLPMSEGKKLYERSALWSKRVDTFLARLRSVTSLEIVLQSHFVAFTSTGPSSRLTPNSEGVVIIRDTDEDSLFITVSQLRDLYFKTPNDAFVKQYLFASDFAASKRAYSRAAAKANPELLLKLTELRSQLEVELLLQETK
jgi:hypothetical protein